MRIDVKCLGLASVCKDIWVVTIVWRLTTAGTCLSVPLIATFGQTLPKRIYNQGSGRVIVGMLARGWKPQSPDLFRDAAFTDPNVISSGWSPTVQRHDRQSEKLRVEHHWQIQFAPCEALPIQ